ncbi:type II toxin-antitoxin system TacA family antitoxin [Desulfolutivibrio sp.]|uniref:type II toxin-antitoxin system TacA family antitoxin n=1 Tax=Desulfolutivibrio sp. TaxID=2773296 RepID=UPI002F96C5DF
MLAFQAHDVDEGKKRVRMEQRLSSEAKEIIEKAARLQGIPLSEFVVANSVMAARETISKLQTTILRPEDAEAFMLALEDTTPCQELVDLFTLHNEVTASHGHK